MYSRTEYAHCSSAIDMLRGVEGAVAPVETLNAFPVMADDESPAAALMLGKWVATYPTTASYVCWRGSSNFLS